MKKEGKKKKHIVRYIVLGIVTLIIIILGTYFGKRLITKIKVNRFSSSLSKLSSEKTNYVFIDINPSFVITIKKNKINNITCLNEDCISIYSDIKILDKNINDGIEYLYNFVKEKGFDTSGGVNVKTNDSIKIDTKKLDYVKVEYIDESIKNELLENVIESKVEDNNDDYYTKLWKKLKKDKDYDKYYTCNMDNGSLECYLIEEAFYCEPKDLKNPTIKEQKKYMDLQQKLIDILSKFNIKTNYNAAKFLTGTSSYVYIDGIAFKYELRTSSIVCDENNNCEETIKYLEVDNQRVGKSCNSNYDCSYSIDKGEECILITDQDDSGNEIYKDNNENIISKEEYNRKKQHCEEKAKEIEQKILNEKKKTIDCYTYILELEKINLVNPHLPKVKKIHVCEH